MLAFDLEKVQHEFQEGKRERVEVYVSSSSSSTVKRVEGVAEEEEEEREVLVGEFPRKKGPVAIDKYGREIGLGLGVDNSTDVGVEEGSKKKEE